MNSSSFYFAVYPGLTGSKTPTLTPVNRRDWAGAQVPVNGSTGWLITKALRRLGCTSASEHRKPLLILPTGSSVLGLYSTSYQRGDGSLAD
ncbi:hypothetical protein [Siminovitchia sp. 179-K 8D1 HS]|uniref:hypothetical protein n=1 Tax=Siminovitchia sp. 179-K 8D1 HS TaxID=3142385 RepID=UPI0039A10F16